MRLCAAAQRVLVFVVLLVAGVSGIGVPGQTCAAMTDDCVCTTEQGVKLEGWRNTTCNQCVLLAQDSGGCELEDWDYETFQFGFMFDIENWRNLHKQDLDMVIDAQSIAVIKIKNSSNVNYPHLTIRGFNTPTCEGCVTVAGLPSWAWSAAGENAAVCANCNDDKIWFFNMHVWASLREVQAQDTVLNFEFYMHGNVYVSRHVEHLVEGMEGLSGNKFMSRGRYQIHEYQMYPLKMSLDRKHFEVDCGVDSNTDKCPYEGEAPGTLMMSQSRGQASYTIKAVVGQNLAVHVPSACKDTIEASSGVFLDKSSGGVYQYELTHDVVHFPTTSGDNSCDDLMRIVIQNSSNPNHTEHFRVSIPADTSNQAAAVALAVIYDTTSDYVSIVDNSGDGASAARTVIASVTVTLSKYADTTLPLVADIDSLLVSALVDGGSNKIDDTVSLLAGDNIVIFKVQGTVVSYDDIVSSTDLFVPGQVVAMWPNGQVLGEKLGSKTTNGWAPQSTTTVTVNIDDVFFIKVSSSNIILSVTGYEPECADKMTLSVGQTYTSLRCASQSSLSAILASVNPDTAFSAADGVVRYDGFSKGAFEFSPETGWSPPTGGNEHRDGIVYSFKLQASLTEIFTTEQNTGRRLLQSHRTPAYIATPHHETRRLLQTELVSRTLDYSKNNMCETIEKCVCTNLISGKDINWHHS